MAYDRSNAVYHLTLRGFEVGDRPADAVETWECDMYQASGYSREQITWTCLWADPNVAREDRDKMREKFKAFMGVPGRSGGRMGGRETSIGVPL